MSKRIVCLGIAFVTFLVLMAFTLYLIRPNAFNKVVVLEDGWTVTYNEDRFENVKLSELRQLIGYGLHKGDVVSLSHDNINLRTYSSPTLRFESRFSAWKLYFHGEEIEEYAIDKYQRGDFIGSEYNYVDLPDFHYPANITIQLYINEDNSYHYFEAPQLGGYQDLLLCVVFDSLFIFFTAAFLVTFGIMFLAVAVGFKSDMPEINMQLYSALMFIDLGLYFLTQFKLMDLFVDTKGLQTLIEYISLYLVVPLMYMIIGCMRNYLKNWLFWLFASGSIIFTLMAYVLHFTGLVHINRFLFAYQIDAIILIALMIWMVLIRDRKKGLLQTSETLQIIGELSVAVAFIFNVFFYYLEIMGVSQQIMVSREAVPMGAMCMVFASLVNYHIFISESISRKSEYTSLAHLAYADELTGIANRSHYEKYMGELNDKNDDFCVISIDLNGLKSINDNLGHLVGDKYLLEFGNVLKESIGDDGFIARIGGDEFVAILTGDKQNDVDAYINNINAALQQLNIKDSSLYRSAAMGYAYRHEVENADWNAVYLLADERMYKNKKSKRR